MMQTVRWTLNRWLLVLLSMTITAILIPMFPLWQFASAASNDVQLGQRDLAGLSYMPMSGVDGIYGPKTSASVRQFQNDNGLTVDGIAGPQTVSALTNKVKQVQHAAKTTADGDYGMRTIAAVKSYQQSHHLKVDGIAGPQTMSAMKIARKVGSKTPSPPTPGSTPVPHGKLADVVTIARAIENGHAEPHWKGGAVPYSWAGGHGSDVGPSYGSCRDDYHGPQPCTANHTVGVDCSGFTRWVYAIAFKADVLGSLGTNDQIKHFQQVDPSKAQPGDLVYFGTSTTNTDHVGIYIGNGRMLDGFGTGTYIRTDPLNAASGFLGYFHYKG